MKSSIPYTEYKSCGKLRRLINKTHNSGVLPLELRIFLRWRMTDESKFHEDGWMEENIQKLKNIIVTTKSKRLRFEKFKIILDDITTYRAPALKNLILAAGRDKSYYEEREVLFPEDTTVTMLMEFSNGYGIIQKISKVSEPCLLIDLELDEYDNDGFPTGKTVLVTYDMESHQRYYHGYKKSPEEKLKDFYEEDEENCIL